VTRASLEKEEEEEYILWMILPRTNQRERVFFPQQLPRNDEGVAGGVSIDSVSPLVLRKKQTNKALWRKKRATRDFCKKRTLKKEEEEDTTKKHNQQKLCM